MKPQEKSSGGGGGGSRAAKKRAKKKQKNKSSAPRKDEAETAAKPEEKATQKKRPLEGEEAEKDVTKPSGILKKSKYSADKTKQSPPKPNEKEDDEKDEQVDATTPDVELPDDFQEILKSNEVSLKDILLLGENQDKKKAPRKKQEGSDSEEEHEEENDPFQQLTSKQRARCALNLLLAPADLTAEDFYEEYWEQKALCVQAKNHRKRFDGFLSLANLRKWTQQHTLYYGRDLNVTRYHTVVPGQPKKRANIDPPPYQDSKTGETKHVQVDSDFVWDQFDQHNATLRLLCPHKQHDAVHALLSLFELEWGCMVGANAYLTPPGASQGFAPHYDDIEAFCLQLEGRKRWKVYAPAKEARLPRASSEDFTDEDMADQEPVLDVILEPGDLLYMPRGWVHQGITLPGNEHSLHLTVSAMQQWAWVDYLELLLPEALEAAAQSETSISLRQGLPRNFLDYMGAMHDQRDDDLPDKLKQGGGSSSSMKGQEDADDDMSVEAEERRRIQQLQEKFRDEAKRRIMRVAKEAMDMVDAACDQIGKRFLSDRLPPGLAPQEAACTTEGQKEVNIWPATLCRLARPGIARLCLEDGKAVLYHCNDNSRVFHEVPLSPMEFEVDDAPALEQLITTVEPDWIPVSELIHEGMEDKIAIAQSLYDEGILAIVNPDGDPK